MWTVNHHTQPFNSLLPEDIKPIKNVLSVASNFRYRPDDFIVTQRLGAGMFGVTFAVVNRVAGHTLVVKRLSKSQVKREQVTREVEVLKYLQPHCRQYFLCYIGYVEDTTNYYIITEFLGQYITLFDYIQGVSAQPITHENLKIIIRNLVNGLKELHRLQVAHRDIKPENIMINPKTLDIKYIDFGSACYGQLCYTSDILGSHLFVAPEVKFLRQPTFNLDLLMKADIWSLGMTILELIMGQPYFVLYIIEIELPGLYDPEFEQEVWNDPDQMNQFILATADRILKDKGEPLDLVSLLPDSIIDDTDLFNSLELMLDKDPQKRRLP